MLEQILAALVPGNSPSRAVRHVWKAMLLLFPVALVAGFLLLVRSTPPPPVPVTIDSAQAIQIARAFALKQGIPVQSWGASCRFGANASLIDFANASPRRIRLWRVAPPVFAFVRFRPVSGDQSASVEVSVDGKVLGFEWKEPPFKAVVLPDAEALSLATGTIPADFEFGPPLIEKASAAWTYTFRSSAIPEANLKATAELRGNRVISHHVRAEINDEAQMASGSHLQTILTIGAVCFVCFVALFSIYRYVSRTLQQEVSHQRSVLVAVLCGFFCVLLGSNTVVNDDSGKVPLTVILVVFAMLGLVGGGLLAVAYGSGEGDVREAWPGKLTSLDALLTGRLFTRNVGVSFLFGTVFASWLALMLAAAILPLRSPEPQGSQSMAAPFVRLGYVISLVTCPLVSLAFGASALLQPLAFMQRYMSRFRRWHIPLVFACGALVSSLRAHARTNAEFLVTSAIFVLALTVPFVAADLLAALVCVTALFAFVGLAGGFATVPAHASVLVVTHAIGVLSVTVFAVLCIKRGEVCTDEQVRPLYARYIVERKSLEAEVSAAREAQLRLLPERTPDFAGLSISAACLPAETVGGDFYDFFPLTDGRLGVFIAEGNNRGLAAALTIALAKGYLMHCVERNRDPVEILASLESALASIFGAESDATGSARFVAQDVFAFAAIDAGRGEIRYARTGAYPKVVVASAHGSAATERMVPVKGRGAPIAEGWAQLSPGDHVLLFTDGLGRRLATSNRKPEEAACSLIRTAARKDTESPGHIRDLLFNYAKDTAEPDDLTLVVIRTDRQEERENIAALGVVA